MDFFYQIQDSSIFLHFKRLCRIWIVFTKVWIFFTELRIVFTMLLDSWKAEIKYRTEFFTALLKWWIPCFIWHLKCIFFTEFCILLEKWINFTKVRIVFTNFWIINRKPCFYGLYCKWIFFNKLWIVFTGWMDIRTGLILPDLG